MCSKKDFEEKVNHCNEVEVAIADTFMITTSINWGTSNHIHQINGLQNRQSENNKDDNNHR